MRSLPKQQKEDPMNTCMRCPDRRVHPNMSSYIVTYKIFNVARGHLELSRMMAVRGPAWIVIQIAVANPFKAVSMILFKERND